MLLLDFIFRLQMNRCCGGHFSQENVAVTSLAMPFLYKPFTTWMSIKNSYDCSIRVFLNSIYYGTKFWYGKLEFFH